jgi:hypothetical protein
MAIQRSQRARRAENSAGLRSLASPPVYAGGFFAPL